MSLETKSIHDLRAIAQSMGVEFKWSDDKEDLLREINLSAMRKIQPPEPVAPI